MLGMYQILSCFVNSYLSTGIAFAEEVTTKSTGAFAPISELATMVTEFGIQIIIAVIMLIFMWRHINNVIKRDNKLFEEMTPKLTEIINAITRMDINITTLITNHNGHSNSELKVIERNQDDIRDINTKNEDMLKNILVQLAVLNGNIEALFRFVVNNANIKNSEPNYNSPPSYVADAKPSSAKDTSEDGK